MSNNKMRYKAGIWAFILAFISASSIALATAAQEPQIVKLEFTWLSIMLFVIILIFIIWVLLRFRNKAEPKQKT